MVGVLLLGRFALSAHMLLVPHEVCSHGKLVHLHHEPAVHETVKPAAHRKVAVRQAVPAHFAHEHCDALGIHEAPPPGAPAAFAGSCVAWPLERDAPPPAIEVAPLPLLLVAPKQSPPRA